MSGTHEYILECDGPNWRGCPNCNAIPHSTARLARKEARDTGWKLGRRVMPGKGGHTPDLCPYCKETPSRESK